MFTGTILALVHWRSVIRIMTVSLYIFIPALVLRGGGQGGGRPGEKGAGGVREAGEDGAGSGRKREK